MANSPKVVIGVTFTRTLEQGNLHLDEELRIESLGDIDMFYYRSKWKGCLWSQWGYWNQFPTYTKAHDIMMFLEKAGWDMQGKGYASSDRQ
jgi:hypothetical protein